MRELNVTEIFHSLQGEGSRAGSANIFIRLQGCKAKDACYASGIRCDTEFESGRPYSAGELLERITDFKCPNIIWTGGEPAQQVTSHLVDLFHEHGYYQAIETSGLFPVPDEIDYVCVSPKVAEHVVAKNFKHVNELRYVRHAGQEIPKPSITADHLYISPHSDGNTLNADNLRHCINLIKANPLWKLSTQLHKAWQIL